MDPRQVEPNLVGGKKWSFASCASCTSYASYLHRFTMTWLYLFLVQSVVENFFADSLFDSRFTSSDFHSFPSTHAIETDPISFNLPSLKSGSVYRINQAVLSISVELLKKDGTKPNNSSKVALGNSIVFFMVKCIHLTINIYISANNSINALFQSSSLSLNGVAINPNTDYHHLRSSMYLWVKYSW